jgi:hypothetical protein
VSPGSGSLDPLPSRRFESMGWIANRLHEQEQLRPGVTPDHAAHVIWLLASFDAYDLLASGRGLDPEAVIDVLTDTADHALLSQTG